MVDYQTIAELVSQIPVDTWNLLREIKQRRPAMMLSELIDYSKRVSQTPQRPELGSLTNEPINPGWRIQPAASGPVRCSITGELAAPSPNNTRLSPGQTTCPGIKGTGPSSRLSPVWRRPEVPRASPA